MNSSSGDEPRHRALPSAAARWAGRARHTRRCSRRARQGHVRWWMLPVHAVAAGSARCGRGRSAEVTWRNPSLASAEDAGPRPRARGPQWIRPVGRGVVNTLAVGSAL